MKIAVSSDTDRMLDSSVSHHFGRCPYFTLVEMQDSEIVSVEAVSNPFFQAHSPGQVPSFIRETGADVMLAGGMGRRAIDIFRSFGIISSTGASGTVRSAVEKYIAGVLPEASPCRESIEHSHDDMTYESRPADRLREEAAELLEKLDDIIVRLPDDKEE